MASKNMKKLKRKLLRGYVVNEENFPVNFVKLTDPDRFKEDGAYGRGNQGKKRG